MTNPANTADAEILRSASRAALVAYPGPVGQHLCVSFVLAANNVEAGGADPGHMTGILGQSARAILGQTRPVEDTDTPCWDCKGIGCAKCSAAPSTVDTSAREFPVELCDPQTRIIDVLRRGNDFDFDYWRPVADAILAALPELAELEQLRQHNAGLVAEGVRLTDELIDVRGERNRWHQHYKEATAERLQLETDLGIARGAAKQYRLQWEYATAANACLLDDPKTATAAENATLRAQLAERNRAYGRASTTIGQLRDRLARAWAERDRLSGELEVTGELRAAARAEVERLKARVLDEARAHSTLVGTLGKVVAEQQPHPDVPERPHHGARVEVTGNDSTRLGYVSGFHKINHGETKFASWIVIVVCDDNAVLAVPLDHVKVIVP